MIRKFPDNAIAFLLEVPDAQILARIERGLHGDGSTLTADQRRDLANLLSEVLERLEVLPEEPPLCIASDKRPMIFFKTGRIYTEHGQRIAAQLLNSGGIIFVDIDRHVQGHFTPEVVKAQKLKLTQADVLWGYDHHDITQYWVNVYGHDEEIAKLQEAARAYKRW